MSYDDDYDDTRARGIPAQTRTRLPDQPESASRRPPTSPGRSMVTIIGVIVILLAAIVFANQTRGGDGDSSSDEPSDESAQATSPTGESPVDGSTNGIPAGFPQTEQGAQSAAANYAVALGGTEMFDADERRLIVDTVYAPSIAADRLTELDAAYSDPGFLDRIGLTAAGTAPDGMTFVSRVSPVGASVAAFDGASATVSVWYSALFGVAGTDSTNPVTESWYTSTYDLVWANDDWKVTDFTQEDGPAPVGRDQRASTAEEMADAIEQFGGFTYAR
ncbi:hypothetical protein [Streptomyces sp. NBC_01803]|uniref:hypothetical protein n=1 Tax=Streptomyces sp. NBC_01803 TaxID=2975946 RepID=UPI003FA35100